MIDQYLNQRKKK